MKIVFSEVQLGHDGQKEFFEGELLAGFETPERALHILSAIKAAKIGEVVAPTVHGLAVAQAIHASDYLTFLQTAWSRWVALGRSGTALPYAWLSSQQCSSKLPVSIDGQLGFYSIDSSTGFVSGTWPAVLHSYETALTGVDLLRAKDEAAYALCRPPGHHASHRSTGGYCFINNAAAAAHYMRQTGAERVAILDIDYHHGNGTQNLFYDRSDVLVVNIHAEPADDYPFFAGYGDEMGAGEGYGFNLNLPLPVGTNWNSWRQAMDFGCDKITEFKPDALVVSLGVDTFEGDPISQFKLAKQHYPLIGRRIAQLMLPTLFVQEGGYAVEEIGQNVAGVLCGFKAP